MSLCTLYSNLQDDITHSVARPNHTGVNVSPWWRTAAVRNICGSAVGCPRVGVVSENLGLCSRCSNTNTRAAITMLSRSRCASRTLGRSVCQLLRQVGHPYHCERPCLGDLCGSSEVSRGYFPWFKARPTGSKGSLIPMWRTGVLSWRPCNVLDSWSATKRRILLKRGIIFQTATC